MNKSLFNSLFISISNINISDIVDIFIVTIFVYIIVTLLIKVASKTLIASISVITGIYILSKVFSLYMTGMLIQIITVFILVAAIVIFQSEIRRVIELFGTWIASGSIKRKHYSNRTTDILTETATKLAEKKVGALIVLKGKENLQRSVNGGVGVNGNVSQVLLYSIFNPKSPGHDGAVIIEGDKILRFGSHLSLSTNLKELQGKGTRHAAALGLSEETDALVTVVSEERGTISIAENGKITELKSSSELKEKLQSFWMKNYEKNNNSYKFDFGLNPYALIFSVLISLMGWILFTNQTDVIYRTFEVPIEFRNLNDNYLLKETAPGQANAILSGSEQAFRILDPKDIKLSIDLKNVKKGNNDFTISESDLDLPKGINLYSINPNTIKIKAEPTKIITLPVKVSTTGKLEKGLKLNSIKVEPEKIKLKIPDSKNNSKSDIYTEPVDLSTIKSDTQIIKRVILNKNQSLAPSQKPEILVTISVSNTKQ